MRAWGSVMQTDDDNKREATHTVPNGSGNDDSYPTSGFKIGDYVIQNILGHGSMSTVFLATDNTGHKVAIKVLREDAQVSTIMLERFRREVEACKILRPHPNIITVYNTGKDGPNHYIVMRHVEGSRTLEDLVNQGNLTSDETLTFIIKIARALHYGHEHNVVHRDVKPTNIMINKFGEPLLADFGTAALTDLPSFTVCGSLTGTPLYMSPEQARSEKATPKSDIYSLAVVLYEAMTGFLPYRVQHLSPVRQVLRAVQKQHPRRPRSLKRGISRDLESVMLKALEKNPDDRYKDAETFAQDLENARDGKPVSAKPFSTAYYAKHLARRHRRSGAILSLLLVIVIGAWTHFSSRILEAQYDGLIGEARLRNADIMLTSASQNAPSAAARAAPAWTRIRASRQAMADNKWTTALNSLGQAMRLAESSSDGRTKAIAELEQARCLTMVNRHEEAATVYTSILSNSNAPQTTLEQALLEGLGLAVLYGKDEQMSSLLAIRVTEEENTFADPVLCLANQLPVEQLLTNVSKLPERQRSRFYFAAALREVADGHPKEAQTLLRKCLAASKDRQWPAPHAKALLSELRK